MINFAKGLIRILPLLVIISFASGCTSSPSVVQPTPSDSSTPLVSPMPSPIASPSPITTPSVKASPESVKPAESFSQQSAVLTSRDRDAQINIRESPSTTSKALHYGLSGDRISILGQTSNSSGETWYEVKFPQLGTSGWVRSDFVAIANASTSESRVSEPKSSPSPSVEQVNNLPSCVKSDCNCSDFSSRAEAERVLAAYPNDPFGLDRDKDGIPCEKLR